MFDLFLMTLLWILVCIAESSLLRDNKESLQPFFALLAGQSEFQSAGRL
jgi:hypothetical protein